MLICQRLNHLSGNFAGHIVHMDLMEALVNTGVGRAVKTNPDWHYNEIKHANERINKGQKRFPAFIVFEPRSGACHYFFLIKF